MDLKEPGNDIYLIGDTRTEMGGSHFNLVHRLDGGTVPHVNRLQAPNVFRALHAAISAGIVRSCHDLSEGGLAVAAAEMAFAGAVGADGIVGHSAGSSDVTARNMCADVGGAA